MSRKLQPVRTCTRCGSSTNGFYKCSKVSDGLSAWCKPCFRSNREAAEAAHPERKQHRLTANANWQKANPAKVVAKVLRYRKAHPERCERSRTRRHLTNRRPTWASPKRIASIYRFSRVLSKFLGEKHVVDHVIPLKHPLVSGLHVETNLQVVPQRVNAAKGNSFIV